MEELTFDFNLDDFEVIEKYNAASKFNFPVAYLSETNNNIYFNSASGDMVSRFIRWMCNAEWIVGVRANAMGENVFSVHSASNSSDIRATTYPKSMQREKKVKPGYVKLYKYKDGFAFKRYERISPDATEGDSYGS